MDRVAYTARTVPAILWWTVALVTTVALTAGCGGREAASGEDAENGYTMGAPITDSTYALIIETEDGGDTLTTALFQTQIQRFLQQMPSAAANPNQLQDLRRGIAEEFIRRHLITEEAERLGLEADSEAVESQIALIRSNVGGQEAFEQALAQRNLTMDSLRSSIAQELRLQQMQEQMLEGAVEPTQTELEAFQQEQAEQVRAQHILFMPEDEDKASAQELAAAVLDSIKAGADFAEMARRYGADGTAQRGGDLGYFSRGDMVEPFAEAAFSLADSGDVYPEPVETSFGYHLIRLTDRRTAEPMDTTRARAMLMQDRQREAYEAAYDSLRANVVVRVNPDVIQADLNDGA